MSEVGWAIANWGYVGQDVGLLYIKARCRNMFCVDWVVIERIERADCGLEAEASVFWIRCKSCTGS